jgi:hypothetical protein
MLKVVEYIQSKAISDPAMATVHKMITENVGATEDCILLLLQTFYEMNQKLMVELLSLKKAAAGKVILTETSIAPSSLSKPERSNK